ncbi:MAG: hypothetical protein LBJ03_01910 [Holosporales bacterium]|nr:hypothetical protein [Holosporales bacterium]
MLGLPSLSVCALSRELVARDVSLRQKLNALNAEYSVTRITEKERSSKEILIRAERYNSLIDKSAKNKEASCAWQMFLKLPDENQFMILEKLGKIAAQAENNLDEEFEKLDWWIRKDLGWMRMSFLSRNNWSALSIEEKIKKTRQVVDGKPEKDKRRLWPLLKAEIQLASYQEFLCLLDQSEEGKKLRATLGIIDEAEQPSTAEVGLVNRGVVALDPDDKSGLSSDEEDGPQAHVQPFSSGVEPFPKTLKKSSEKKPASKAPVTAKATTIGSGITGFTTPWVSSEVGAFRGLSKIYFWPMDRSAINNWSRSYTDASSARPNMGSMARWTLVSGTIKSTSVDLYISTGAFVFSWTDPMSYWDHIFKLESQINALKSARRPLLGSIASEEFRDMSILQKMSELNAFRMLAIFGY